MFLSHLLMDMSEIQALVGSLRATQSVVLGLVGVFLLHPPPGLGRGMSAFRPCLFSCRLVHLRELCFTEKRFTEACCHQLVFQEQGGVQD